MKRLSRLKYLILEASMPEPSGEGYDLMTGELIEFHFSDKEKKFLKFLKLYRLTKYKIVKWLDDLFEKEERDDRDPYDSW
ncbi:hypothetical protein HN960_05455 [Candidatus Peregrinibacteria bacterium]|jgi:hypothetical protein|nr:hypothetical protein [Candidatus Peregrinibacteria bacterium]